MTFTWIAGLRKCGAGQVQPVHPTLGTAGTEHSHTWERAAALSVHCSGWDPFTAHCPVQGLAAGLALPLSPKPAAAKCFTWFIYLLIPFTLCHHSDSCPFCFQDSF